MKINFPILLLRVQPNPALATFDQAIICLPLFFQWFQRFAEINDVLVLVVPLLEHRELVYNFILYFSDTHSSIAVMPIMSIFFFNAFSSTVFGTGNLPLKGT